MALTLYFHPLSSFCHKVSMGLYEMGVPFTPEMVNLGDRGGSAFFFEMWPMGKIPVLRDSARERAIPETTVMLEYVDQHYFGKQAGNAQKLFPPDAEKCLEARLWDRFFDGFVQVPMQKIVGDLLRSEAERDARGVADAKATLATAYGVLEKRLNADAGPWIVGETFSVADCAAAPALFYADIAAPFSPTHPKLAAYFERLLARPSYRRTLDEARPYFEYFPLEDQMPKRFL